ncbi:MAG TPA: hypothetical protein PK187_05940 [Candidatus Syntrophosphaera thermopropionivorans]|nr:hypothetical protein [Candidatus Syntrophosphaera thermopropionivorans]
MKVRCSIKWEKPASSSFSQALPILMYSCKQMTGSEFPGWYMYFKLLGKKPETAGFTSDSDKGLIQNFNV